MELRTTYTTINEEQIARNKEWVDISWLFEIPENRFLPIEIQRLGKCEMLLLDMDNKFQKNHLKLKNATLPERQLHELQNAFFFEQHIGFSQYWIFGLYEVLRTFKQALLRQAQANKTYDKNKKGFPEGEFESFNDLFLLLEVLRTPLAKNEIAKSGEYSKKKGINGYIQHYGTPVYDEEKIGWQVFDTEKECFVVLTRKEIADRFLKIAKEINERQNNLETKLSSPEFFEEKL